MKKATLQTTMKDWLKNESNKISTQSRPTHGQNDSRLVYAYDNEGRSNDGYGRRWHDTLYDRLAHVCRNLFDLEMRLDGTTKTIRLCLE